MNRSLLLTLAMVAIGCWLTYQFTGNRTVEHHVSNQPVYDRVMKTHTIRCGYINFWPAEQRDPQSGDMKGYVVDYFNAMGKALALKIEWTEEINLGTYLADLNSHRYDLECAGGWPSAVRGKLIYYTDPFAYSSLVPFVRADETRFDSGFDTLFQPGLKAAVVDGDTSQIIRRAKFPDMQEVSIPQVSAISEYFVMVTSGKADMTFSDYIGGMQYIEKNPGKIKPLPYKLRLVPQSIGVPQGEDNLLHMLNTANQQLELDGTIDAILDKYETAPGMFTRVTKNLGLAERKK